MNKLLNYKVLFATLTFIILTYFSFHPLIYQKNYFCKIGIGNSHLYNNIIQKKGTPLDIKRTDDGNWNVYYDGLKITYGTQLNTGVFKCVTITGNQYKFGMWKIGIGTPRTKVESVYRHIKKVKDLPTNEFGVIDGGTWVWFKFDKDNNVIQLDLTTNV